MKTGSGRVVELAAKDDGETSVKEVEGLSNTYQSTVCTGIDTLLLEQDPRKLRAQLVLALALKGMLTPSPW